MMKVVTANEMRRIEAAAIAQGSSEEAFMDEAGKSIASVVEEYIADHGCARVVTLLVGKGNNGGDAYVAGSYLMDKGFSVRALHLYPLTSCTPLCQKMHARFVQQGGKVEESDYLGAEGILLDGLVGTGFHGAPDPLLAKMIQAANNSRLPILSIDIPSGLCGNTGRVETVAIHATLTIFLGLPKWGFFVEQGWDHVGDLAYADFGLPQKWIDQMASYAYLPSKEDLLALVPPIKRTRHKYNAGYVIAVAGSPGMPGAAILSSFATLRTGAGIVRLFHPVGMEAELACSPYEIIREGWNSSPRLLTEAKRADAFLIGPGLGRERSIKNKLKSLLPKIKIPCVLDADALYFLAEYPSWKLPQQCVLTPHRKEMARLLNQKSLENWREACQEFVEKKKVTLVLKGAPTFIFHPGSKPLVLTYGDPGMATAGTGDVLTGMIAALLAQKLPCQEAAQLGVALHGMAGEIAACEKGSHSMIASDLLEAIPIILSELSCAKRAAE